MTITHDGDAADCVKTLRALFPCAVFALLSAISFGRWIEPYVDSGRELMVPARLAAGERLYRDVRFFHGPLAPYAAAGIETFTGRSLPARILFALAIALLHIEALRRLAGRLLPSGRAAFATGLVVATTFFLPPGGCHLFPFSFDTAVAVAAITGALALASGRTDPAREWIAGALLLAGLLSRPELGLGGIAVLLVERASPARFLRVGALPLAGAAALYALLSSDTPTATLRREGWLAIVGPPEAFRNVYASYAGLDRPALRAAELALCSVVLLVFGAVLVAGSFLAQRATSKSPPLAAILGAASVALLAAVAGAALWPPRSLAATLSLFPPLVRVIPPILALGAASRILRRLRGRRPSGLLADVPDGVVLAAALFAARLFLAAGYAGPYNGFLLPLPLLLSVVALFRIADRATASAGSALPKLLTAALGVFFAFRIGVAARTFRHPGWARVETPAGSLFLTEPVAGTTRAALADLAARVPSGGTLTGFPEAGFFEYCLRLTNPLPQEQFFPGHLDAAEETRTIARLRLHPPNAILYADVLAVGHRAVAFGTDYLRELDRFVRAAFEPAASYGPGAGADPRIGDPQFFLQVRVPGPALSGAR